MGAQTSHDISESILTMKKDKILRLQEEIEENSELVASATMKIQESAQSAMLAEERTAEMQVRLDKSEAQILSLKSELQKVREDGDAVRTRLDAQTESLEARAARIRCLERQVIDQREEAEAKVAQEHNRMQTLIDEESLNTMKVERDAAQQIQEIERKHTAALEEAANKLAQETELRLNAVAQCSDQAEEILTLHKEIASLREQLRVAQTPVITNQVSRAPTTHKKMGPKPQWCNPGVST